MKMECQRWPEMPLILGRSGTQDVAIGNKTVKLKLWSTFSRILLQRYKLAEIHVSFFCLSGLMVFEMIRT